ncbi:MAG: choice-of-anchor X domain-containing protein [Candidatus Electrothrix sp. YB6]
MKKAHKYRNFALIAALTSGFVFQSGFQSASAGGSWFSKARQEQQLQPKSPMARTAGSVPMTSGDIGTTVFDMVISLYNNPTIPGEQQPYEKIIRFWADAVYEQSNGAFKLGKIRIFRNGLYGSLADVVWNNSEWPRAYPSGFGVMQLPIIFGDIFPDGCGSGCDYDFLESATHQRGGGYTLAHEFGHYVLGLYDEYRGSAGTSPWISTPLAGDTPVVPSIMHNQWNALGGDFTWLNHSTSNNYQADTAQGRCYGAGSWEVMTRPIADDPKVGQQATLAQRVHYTGLDGNEPTAADSWMRLELPGQQSNARNQLDIIWMQDDIEMQIVFDRSGSMLGDPLNNAKQAALTLADEAKNSNTSLGLVSFSNTPVQDEPVGTPTEEIKLAIDALEAGGCTAMFDAAKLSLDNLSAADNAKLVFLLSDGEDNVSDIPAGCEDECQDRLFCSAAPVQDACQECLRNKVIGAYHGTDIPLNTFAYGQFAPDGTLRQLAEATGGIFRTTPTELAELQSAFLAAKAAQTASVAVLQKKAATPAGSSIEFPFAVDGTMKKFAVFANYKGTDDAVNFTLNGPDGPAADFACTAVSDAVSCTSMIAESDIQLGAWSLIAENNTSESIDVGVDILADPKSERTYDLVVSSLNGTEVTYPNPILLTAVPGKGLPITGVSISATVTDPDGIVTPVTLKDTGENGDGIAGDGVYSAILDYTRDGNYLVRLTVDNHEQKAEFTVKGYAPSAAEDGSMPTPEYPPITENFTRTASAQVVVSGFADDDHPDTAPGTDVTPDNSDMPGRIDTAGDLDVFTVATTDYDYLVFRVTDLALGMETRLRILAEDGTTEIAGATMEQMSSDAEYVALTVPVDGNAELHAEVSHASGGTGTYHFSAGSRIFREPTIGVNAEITGMIIDKPQEDHRDVASFEIKGATGIKAATTYAAAGEIPLKFQFGGDDGPIYSFTGADFDAAGNRLVYSDADGNMVRCIFNKEICTIKIRYVDFDGEALDNLLSGNMTVSLEIGDTNYTNTGIWEQIDSGSGTWTKYRKDN